MQPLPIRGAGSSSRTWSTPPAISTFGADAPSRDECARERRIREIDRDRVIEHPATPDGVIAPSAQWGHPV
jgi:hypothetical protein